MLPYTSTAIQTATASSSTSSTYTSISSVNDVYFDEEDDE
jgi:hypothetical protein